MNKKILKKLIFTTLITGTVLNANAVAPGFYMGLMMGPATNSGKNADVLVAPPNPTPTTPATPKSNQFGSRLFMGYQISNYAGVEGGLTYFSGIHYDTKNVQVSAPPTIRVRDFDLVAKGIIPMGTSFDVFGKAGVAVVYQTTSGSMNPDGNSSYTNKFTPTFSVGASYNINQSWVTDLSINRILTGGAANNVTYAALGISYHFVDVFCGQFLC